jgi:ABC-type lipoprotein export system ATPase subunit
MTAHSPSGSLWNRWDLHFHTPSSFDYADGGVTNQQIVDRLIREGIRVVAVTDHHVMDVGRIRDLQKLGGDRLTVLPGIELRSELGAKPIHYICIFPEECDLDHVWTTLQGALGLTAAGVEASGGNDKVYVPIEKGAKATRGLGGIVSIHAGGKSNSIEGIENTEQFQQRVKYDITKQWVDVMEIGQIKDIDRYFRTVFPTIGLEKPLVICSDNHDIENYTPKAPLWLRADPTFRGLLMMLREPRDRVFIGSMPPEVARVQQNPTKYVRSIAFSRRGGAATSETWFNGNIPFSSGLIAIVGNKGSGKSALADTLGLLGGTKNSGAFSFLSKDRFRHPASGLAGSFEASLTWESGDAATKCLADAVGPEEVERIKYLPQDHVERVCNELASSGVQAFEQELKAVIFSHVADAERLGHASLDDLVRFRTGEKQKRIDALVKQLREASRARSLLEAQSSPAVRRELTEQVKRRQLELEAHDKAKPPIVGDPGATAGNAAPDAGTMKELQDAESARKSVVDAVAGAELSLRGAERRRAVAVRLLEKLTNFQKEFSTFVPTLSADVIELELDAVTLVSLTLNREPVEGVRDAASKVVEAQKSALSSGTPPGLREQLVALDEKIAALQTSLDAPNRAYQTYLSALAEWEARRIALTGTAEEPETLKGLEAAVTDLDGLPEKIKTAQQQLKALALEVHAEKCAQAEVYRTLYGAVQAFIDSHPLAKDKLKLEFRAELTEEDFPERLLALLALNRRGSFMGVDEGRSRAVALVEQTTWGDAASIERFLDGVDEALHKDLRDEKKAPVQLGDQLAGKKRAEEVFDLLYGLEYVRPRYILRWDGKDLSMLSPGERGTLLLVFYLLIDKSDIPLVIDQPEGNLDNHTVAKVLVECIKESRRRRQVFIVTHNPNLAVVCDADQIIHAEIDKAHGNAISYSTGALENPIMSRYVTDVLEGTRWAFDVRGDKYDVSA